LSSFSALLLLMRQAGPLQEMAAVLLLLMRQAGPLQEMAAVLLLFSLLCSA
jgi:hypothetical protein